MTHTFGMKNSSLYMVGGSFALSLVLTAAAFRISPTPAEAETTKNQAATTIIDITPIEMPSRYLMNAQDFESNATLMAMSYDELRMLKKQKTMLLDMNTKRIDEFPTEATVIGKAYSMDRTAVDFHIVRGDGDTYIRVSRTSDNQNFKVEDIPAPSRPEYSPCSADPKACDATLKELKQIVGLEPA